MVEQRGRSNSSFGSQSDQKRIAFWGLLSNPTAQSLTPIDSYIEDWTRFIFVGDRKAPMYGLNLRD